MSLDWWHQIKRLKNLTHDKYTIKRKYRYLFLKNLVGEKQDDKRKRDPLSQSDKVAVKAPTTTLTFA